MAASEGELVELETEKILVVSTAHACPGDMSILYSIASEQADCAKSAHVKREPHLYDTGALEVHGRGYGYLMKLSLIDAHEEIYQELWEDLKSKGFSLEFHVLLRFAQERKFRWVLLDADADKITGLPEGQWGKH